jgi:Flp pilus assembly protein TadD
MAHATTPPPPAPPESVPGTPGRGLGRRLLHALLAPARFARRRPGRVAVYVGVFLLLVAVTVAARVWLWFDHHLDAARAELAAGHNAAAMRHLRQCERLAPDAREVLLLGARAARKSGAWDDAELYLTRYHERHGDEDGLVLERLLLRCTRGEVEAVHAALAARIRDGGADAALAREALVTGLLYRFRWVEALRQLDEWQAAEPNSTAALLLRGKLDEQRQNFPRAVEHYRRVLELDPRHDEARLRLTTLLLADRKGGEALEQLALLRESLPEHPEVAVQWVKALALQGRTEESRAALEACLRDHPDYPAALAERGSQALFDGEEPTAERYLARAVELDPGNLVTRNQYALTLARNGKRAEAARENAAIAALSADLDRISALTSGPLQANPNDPTVHHEIAQIALRSGQIREALRWFHSALQADPNHAPTHRALGVLYHELDQPILSARHRALANRGSLPGP